MPDRTRAPIPLGLILAALLPLPGCGVVPKSRVEEAHKLVQSLRAENAQMKDTALTLKVQNQDLTQRAVDDARAIQALEVANARYEKSIQGYQDEREQLRQAFREVQAQARVASGGP